MTNLSFFNRKKVLITGHTGFKGSWLSRVLVNAGAEVTGYALEPVEPALFSLSDIKKDMRSVTGDIRNYNGLMKIFQSVRPEVVFHLAAQPLVRESYRNPLMTYETNVMGTVNVLECIRHTESVHSFLNVTTDKVYKNREWDWGYREIEELNGFDPYSNSKSCSELVTESYYNSFLKERGVAVSTARAGNVIGGGDFAKDRIIPDCIRSAMAGEHIVVRNPYSVRPYQHVLEPVMAYLMIAARQYEEPQYASQYNVGPEDQDCLQTGRLVSVFCEKWLQHTGKAVDWEDKYDGGPHEANFLKLDCSRIKSVFGWKPIWDIEKAIDAVVEWAVAYRNGENTMVCMDRQIQQYITMQETMKQK